MTKEENINAALDQVDGIITFAKAAQRYLMAIKMPINSDKPAPDAAGLVGTMEAAIAYLQGVRTGETFEESDLVGKLQSALAAFEKEAGIVGIAWDQHEGEVADETG